MSDINTLFQKQFSLSKVPYSEVMYTLPEPESMFKEPPWQLDDLQMLKNSLNKVKSRLNNYNLQQWHQHTNHMNKAGDIVGAVKKFIKAELVTQAWCKFYEIASKFSLVPKKICRERSGGNFTSVHLCEAPGAFVAALNHWLLTNASDVQWDWLAITLNPYCEGNPYDMMVADDRFIRHTLKHWCFGADNTGNIMDLRNLDALVERSGSIDGRPILLVTADGSIDCTNVPAEQESTVAQLHFCETVACIHLLQKGGNFLLKLFTLFEHQSVCLMYLLSCAFYSVIITKPASSKGGNSEIYVICLNFKGKDYMAPYLNILRQHYGSVSPATAMFSLKDIPTIFLQQIKECGRYFMRHQCQVIEDNINAYHNARYRIPVNLSLIKQTVTAKYLKNCKLRQIDPAKRIVGREIIERSNNCFINKKFHSVHLEKIDSYNERCKRFDFEPQELLHRYFSEAKEIESPTEKSYIWNLQALPETLEIQVGKLFNKVRSSCFCDARILQILNGIDDVIHHMRFAVCFPPADITTELAQQIDSNYEMLNFQFDCDSHRTIAGVCDRLEKLQVGQTLILVGYSLLTQFNVGLLYLLRNTFDMTNIEVQDYEGYHIKLKTYQRDDKVLKYLREILTASHNAHKENMAIWSIIPMTILYECDQFLMIMQLNHLVIKQYAQYIFHKLGDVTAM